MPQDNKSVFDGIPRTPENQNTEPVAELLGFLLILLVLVIIGIVSFIGSLDPTYGVDF